MTKRILILALLAAACGDGGVAVTEATGTLETNPINIGFGCTKIGCDGEKVVTVRNAGKGELYVRSVTFDDTASKEFTYSTDKVLPVALRSGDQLLIAIHYRPEDESADAGVLIIEHNGKTAPGTRIGERPYQALVFVRSRELGIPHLKARPALVSFGYVPPGSEKVLKVQVENDGTGTAILAMEPPEVKSGLALPFVIEPLANGDLLVNPKETKSVSVKFKPVVGGLFEDTLVLKSNDGEVLTPAEVKLQGTSYLGPKMVAQPATLDFGEVRVGTEKTMTVIFRSAGSEPLEYQGMSVHPIPNGSVSIAAQFTAQAVGSVDRYLDTFATVEANVTFKPTELAIGAAVARVIVSTPNAADPSEIALTATSTNPILDVTCKLPTPAGLTCRNTPLEMDFGMVVAGWRVAPIPFEITNSGSGNLHIEKIRLMPGSALSFGLEGLPTFPMEIPPGVTVSGKVTFGSGGIGNTIGTVGIYTYSESAPAKTIALKAFGRSCEDHCPLPNATPSCATTDDQGNGLCTIWKCDVGYYDINVTPGDGCECIVETAEPKNFCSTGVQIGAMGIGNSRTYGANKIVPATDVDWYSVYAEDDQFFGNEWDFNVTLSGAGFVMCVYRAEDSGCLGVDTNAPCQPVTSYSLNGSRFSNDSAYFHIKVFRDPSAPSCDPYVLFVRND